MTYLLLATHLAITPQTIQKPQMTEMAGYLIVPQERVSPEYNAGFSMYVAAWPLQKNYPGSRFQSGLFGTWMFPQFDGDKPEDFYTDIEGGLGWWRDTRFATETPKFIMGGVALNFSEWANGPGAGKGRNWDNPTGLYGVAQLSPWILWPPDGLNLRQGTRGELFGYGYLPLPLTEPKSKTKGVDVPTGNQSWTLFINSANFKGPVAFFPPYFWSKASIKKPELAGKFLDSRPSEPNKAIQMETQHIPAMIAKDSKGATYAKIAKTHFPGNPNQQAPLIHRITSYKKEALWTQVEKWFQGNAATSGSIQESASTTHNFKTGGSATWRIYIPGIERNKSPRVNWNSIATSAVPKSDTYSFNWNKDALPDQQNSNSLLTLPEYFKLVKRPNGQEWWEVIPKDEVAPETGLLTTQFPKPTRPTDPYVTPTKPDSSWKSPGPVAGPFKRAIGDGSEVTYYWYRFADQPALLNSDLTKAEREAIQKRVEKIHQTWTKTKTYLPNPTTGTLAHIDPALIVTPPKGLEIGYVPLVTRQAWQPSRQPN